MLGKGKSDPYAVITVGAQEFKTKVINNSVDPKWDYWCEVSHSSEFFQMFVVCFQGCVNDIVISFILFFILFLACIFLLLLKHADQNLYDKTDVYGLSRLRILEITKKC